MGAFSVHHDVVQNLLALGIPVWLVRRSEQVPADAVIKKMIPAIHQTSIEMGLGPFPTQAIYSGYAGTDEHFSAIWRSAYRMLDIEHILIDDAFVEKEKMITAFPEHATIAMATSCTPSTSSTPAPGVIRSTHSHTKSHPYDRQPSTKNKVTKAPNIRALANVDRAKATANTWGYWVPEPHILVGSEGILRVQNYLRNWFWVREAWYYMLAHRALRFDPLPSKLWRDWLQNDADKVKEYTKDSKCAKRKAYVMNLFKQHFPDVVSQPPAKDTLLWYNQRYSSPPPDSIIRQIAWESPLILVTMVVVWSSFVKKESPRHFPTVNSCDPFSSQPEIADWLLPILKTADAA
ncbi:hypothetical protein EW026_g4268 [Hermanssonia centrifuga]|uniref:Uncharacterized protein n=1 Tax=Hermanssonia centrifuga TaxID=98765 RepID=A0A4S4KIU0_9APHY|nr:hypothetical protein EW026_g4268 [Hermanssonia centrifuga]